MSKLMMAASVLHTVSLIIFFVIYFLSTAFNSLEKIALSFYSIELTPVLIMITGIIYLVLRKDKINTEF